MTMTMTSRYRCARCADTGISILNPDGPVCNHQASAGDLCEPDYWPLCTCLVYAPAACVVHGKRPLLCPGCKTIGGHARGCVVGAWRRT
jgi:hypothetical protein